MSDLPPSAASPSARIASVDAMLSLGDATFVRAAYRALLGREADDDGLATYTALVRAGADKEELVVALATSAEARQRQQTLDGLDALVARLSAPPIPPLRRLWRWMTGVQQRQSTEAIVRALRVIDNRLHLIETGAHETSTSLEELRAAVAKLAVEVQSQGASEPRTDGLTPGSGAARRQVPPVLRGLVAGLLRMRARRTETGDPVGP